MDINQTYIENVAMEDVPWHRLTTPYGRATEFPVWFQDVGNMSDMATVKIVLDEILSKAEHQGTLWQCTPFAMIFLVRIFEHTLADIERSEVARFIAEQLLKFFIEIAECCHDVGDMEHVEPLPLFSDMLQEQYLWSEEYDKEADEIRWEADEVFPEDLFYSFWYYAYQSLLRCKPILEKVAYPPLAARVHTLNELLSSRA